MARRLHWAGVGADSADEFVGSGYERVGEDVGRTNAIGAEEPGLVDGGVPCDHVPERCTNQQPVGLDDTARRGAGSIVVLEGEQAFLAECQFEEAGQ